MLAGHGYLIIVVVAALILVAVAVTVCTFAGLRVAHHDHAGRQFVERVVIPRQLGWPVVAPSLTVWC
jgi:hypothetical protein